MSTTLGTTISPLDKALVNYQKELEKRIKAATSDKNAKTQSYSSSLDQLQNKTCSYLKLIAAKGLYINLDQCISISAHKESELINDNVEAMIKESGTLKEQLATLSKTLKSVKMEVYTAKELACNLVDCCLEKEKHENPGIYNDLCLIPDFQKQIDDIKDDSEKCYSMAELTFDAAINVSGIQGFACVDSLKKYSENLVLTLEGLNKNVADNCKSLTSSIETIIEERSEMVSEVSVSKYACNEAKCEESALCDTWNKSCDPCDQTDDKPSKGKVKLEAICLKLQCVTPDGSTPGKSKIPVGNKPQF